MQSHVQLKQFYTTFIDRSSFLSVSSALHAFRNFLESNLKETRKKKQKTKTKE